MAKSSGTIDQRTGESLPGDSEASQFVRRAAAGATNCPSCGIQLADGPKIAGRKHPGRHDVSICRGCAEIVILTESERGIALRPTTAAEYLALPEKAQSLLRVAFELVQRSLRHLHS